MKAMILAAGAGTRMGNLTQETAKPLLTVKHKPLMVYLIEQIAAAGFSEILINVSKFKEQFEKQIGDGSRWDIPITYSYEATPLGPAGGVVNALPLLGDDAFLVVSGDIWTDYPFAQLNTPLGYGVEAHGVLVPKVQWPEIGEFGFDHGFLTLEKHYGYGAICVFTPNFFRSIPMEENFLPYFKRGITKKTVTAECYKGLWCNVGTPEQLAVLNATEST